MAADGNKPTYVSRVRDNTRKYIEELLQENQRLRSTAEQLTGEVQKFADRFAEIEHQNSNLAMLYAASYQLHATVRRSEVLLAIQEIVINLVGSEAVAIVSVEPDGSLTALASFGVSSGRIAELRGEFGLLGAALGSGRPRVAPDATGDGRGMTACIPLMIGARPFAAIAIFELLPQKPVLTSVDLEMFDLLATHAANALYCADLHDRHGDGP
jgi:GAF domain-containing protein